MDKNLNTYLEYIQKKEQDVNYFPTAEENTAIYEIENDPSYADLANSLLAAQSYQEALAIVNQYVKEDEYKQEQLSVDESLNNDEVDEFDRILKEEMEISKINKNMEDVKSNIVMYYNDPSKIEEIQDLQEKDFYYKMTDEYKKYKDEELGKKNANKMGLTYQNADLSNHGYVHLLLISIVLTIIAFIILINMK